MNTRFILLFLASAALALAQVTIPWADVSKSGSNLNEIATRNFSDLQNKPTTLAGYGITDGQPLDSDLTSIAALSTTAYGRGLLILANSAAFTANVDAATTSAAGKVELATNAETAAKTDSERAVTAAGLAYATDAQFAARFAADYLQSDGATANRRIETVYGAIGAIAGSDLTEVDYVFDVPTSNPSTTCYVFAHSSVNSSGSPINSLGCYMFTSGGLYIDAYGNPTTNARSFGFTGFRAAYSGRRVRLTVAFSSNTANPVVWVDGVDVSSSFVVTTGGTPPNWVDAALVSTYHLRGLGWPTGYFRPGRPVNRKYTQADVDFVQLTGRLPLRDAQGSQVALTTIGESFTAGVADGWATHGTVTATEEVADVYAGSKAQKLSVTVSNSGITNSAEVTAARAGTVRVTGYAKALNTGTLRVRLAGTSGGLGLGYAEFGPASFAAWAPFTADLFLDALASGRCEFSIIGTGDWLLDGVSAKLLGALSEPIVQPILVVGDSTGNGRGSLVVGFTPVTSKRDWVIQGATASDAAGGTQLLGGSLFANYTRHMLDTLETNGTSTATISIGNATGALTTYKASGALSNGRNRHTIVTPILSTASIWVASSTTDNLRHTIRGHVID